ncbi:MAG: DUF309 domain-containing protein, partial [Myxococcales bacterium]|nr:DUF309 domain-containing protein [Myxococcales bacterium]
MLTTAQAAPPAGGSAPDPANNAGAAPTAGSPASPGTGASASPSDPEARAEQAANLYSARKYVEAAEILEDLWATVHEPRDLFNAALARIAAGHRAHAIRYWETYLLLPG